MWDTSSELPPLWFHSCTRLNWKPFRLGQSVFGTLTWVTVFSRNKSGVAVQEKNGVSGGLWVWGDLSFNTLMMSPHPIWYTSSTGLWVKECRKRLIPYKSQQWTHPTIVTSWQPIPSSEEYQPSKICRKGGNISKVGWVSESLLILKKLLSPKLLLVSKLVSTTTQIQETRDLVPSHSSLEDRWWLSS